MKIILIGEDNFKAIVAGGFYYIDKTKFIEEIINNFGGVKLFLRPRRFGKTTNMQMIKEYFNIVKKEENKDLFKGLYIDNQENCKKYQGAYPVIFMSLKEAKNDTWKNMYEALKNMITKIYKDNRNVKDILEDFEVHEYDSIMLGKAS